MKRITVVALFVVGMLASSGLTAGASAELPEFGHCIKEAGGAFKNAGCTVASTPGEENYNWSPGAGGTFAGTAPAKSLPLTFEALGGEKVTCSGAFDGGTYIGTKTVLIHLVFTGCVSGGVTCQDDPPEKGKPPFTEPGEVGFGPLEGKLGFIKAGAKPSVGIDIVAGFGGPLVIFECGGGGSGEGAQTIVTGSVIAKTGPIEKMTAKFKWKFKAKKGKQKPEHFAGEPKDTLSSTVPFLSEVKGVEQAGLTLRLTNINSGEEKLEIKAVP
jgi:hypothetical protein